MNCVTPIPGLRPDVIQTDRNASFFRYEFVGVTQLNGMGTLRRIQSVADAATSFPLSVSWRPVF